MPIIVENLTHVYMKGSPFEAVALDDVSFEIQDGEFVGLIGHTGSGKSTLVQHLNGLLKPTKGRIIVDGIDITEKSKSTKWLRQHVGLVFQYPEHQLFEETVYLDIAFGPKNLNLPDDEVEKRVREAMDLVGLDYESLKDRSPFEISGGQRRRVAIAGVLAMKPKVLILDEPTAGLDPRGRDEILGQIKDLHRERGLTIILVSHSMEDIAKLVDRIIVMNNSRIALMGTPEEVFSHVDELHAMGLGIPQITHVIRGLRERGMDVPENIYTVEQAAAAILEKIRGERMLKDITIGQFFPGESSIHRLDPRIKIIITLIFIVIIFFVKSFIGYAMILAYMSLAVFLSGVPVRYMLRGLKPLLFIILLTFFINIFFTSGENIIFKFWFLTLTQEGLLQGIFMGLRLIFLVAGTSLLTLTTSPIALTDGIEHLLKPLKVIRFPVHELAMMMTIALRFIPTLLEETDKIMKAQMARGADFESGNLFQRAKALVPLLVPLFISAFRRADELAMAMESRCYRGGENRTRMKTLKTAARDYAALAVTLLLVLGILLNSYL